jgi:23S rRNA (uracil1939-C5)-methyltransferase
MSRPKRPSAPRKRRPAAKQFELTIEALNDEGLATGRHEGKDVLVCGALPGERAIIAAEHEGQRRIAGQLVRLLNKSPQRVAPPCPRLLQCQSCSLMPLAYPDQMRFKEDKVRRALAGYPELGQVRLSPIWAAPEPLGYRTNAKLALARHKGRIVAGLYRRGSHEVVDIGACPLHHPLINRIVAVVREEIQRQDIFIYNPITRRGLLRYLLVKVSPTGNKALVTFVTAERDYRRITPLAKWLKRKVPEVVGVHQNVNASSGNVILGRETLRVLGVPDLIDQVGDIRLRISPTAFFQVNHAQAARIYALVSRWAGVRPEEYALDLYCGIGGIALHLARQAGRVIGIEAVEDAVRNARHNAAMNSLENCSFRAGDAAELLQEVAGDLPPTGVAVVNPPRSGCDGQVLQVLAGLGPRALIYVSCNPATLARDLVELTRLGYRAEEVQPVDMFPQTAHVESVARLVKTGPAK